MWVCGRESAGYSESALWMIPTSGTNGSISGVTATDDSTAIYEDEHAVCTPLTEIYSGSTDYLYLSEGITNNASGLGTNYTNFASFYGFTLSDTAGTATAIAGSPITEPTATGGSSGIVVDNMFTEPYWQASHAYSQDTLITDSKGNVEKCVTAGTSGTASALFRVQKRGGDAAFVVVLEQAVFLRRPLVRIAPAGGDEPGDRPARHAAHGLNEHLKLVTVGEAPHHLADVVAGQGVQSR